MKYYDDNKIILDKLQNDSHEEMVHGLKVFVKDIPDSMEKTVLDPRVYAKRKKEAESTNELSQYDEIPVALVRAEPTYPSKDITECNISIQEKLIRTQNRKTPITIYTPEGGKEIKPAMLYIHGGAFIAGSTKAVENFCKLLAEVCDMVIVGVDYRLAPENQFPAGANDCYNAFDWMYKHAFDLNIDPAKLCVGGDSAGATLAIDCCIYEREQIKAAIEEGFLPKETPLSGRIVYSALIYPGVIVNNIRTEDFRWRMSDYEIPDDDVLAMGAAVSLKAMTAEMAKWYMGTDGKIMDPVAAPLLQESLNGLPKALMVLCEFDYLRLSAEAYGRKMEREGVACKNILYKGMDHSFIDKVGDIPQAYDLAIEIAKDVKAL